MRLQSRHGWIDASQQPIESSSPTPPPCQWPLEDPPPPGAIIDACSNGDLETLIAFFEKDPPTTKTLAWCFYEACRSHRADVVSYLLRNGAEINNFSVEKACLHADSVEVFEVLLEYGWDINSEVGRPRNGKTALTYMLRNEETVKWFLARGADPSLGPPATWMDGELTPNVSFILDMASGTSLSVVDLLLQHGAKIEKSVVLHSAAGTTRDRTEFMSGLLDRGADINKYFDSRWFHFCGTPLDHAVRARNVEHVHFLLRRGADSAFKAEPWSLSSLEQAEKSRYPSSEILELLRAFAGSGYLGRS